MKCQGGSFSLRFYALAGRLRYVFKSYNTAGKTLSRGPEAGRCKPCGICTVFDKQTRGGWVTFQAKGRKVRTRARKSQEPVRLQSSQFS